jgi:hypothetical protein
MKSLFLFLTVISFYVCKAQKLDANNLIGKSRICKATAVSMAFIFFEQTR